LFGAQLANPVIGVHPCHGDAEDHNHCYQSNQIAVHMCSSKAAAARRQLLIADIVMYGGGCGEVPGNSASKESRVGDPAPHQREIWVQEESRVGDPAPHQREIWVQEESRVGDPAPHLYRCGTGSLWDRVFDPVRWPQPWEIQVKKKAGSEPRLHTSGRFGFKRKAGSETRLHTRLHTFTVVGPGLCGTGSLTRSGGNQSTGSGPFHSHR